MAGIGARLLAPLLGVGLVATLLSACSSSTTPPSQPSPPPITVTVEGLPRQVPQGTSFGELLRQLEIHAKAGRLLSVTGAVLVPHAYPGSVLLNGSNPPRATTLAAGDTIAVVDGRDRTEDTKRVATLLKGFRYGDPEFTLSTYSLREIDTVGKISGEVQSVEYHPVGKARVPGQVALTFDDGPWPDSTRRVLSVLRRFHVKATFFMIGENVQKWPGIAHDVVRAGMTVGNHSWDHPLSPVFADISPSRLHNEVANTDAILRQVGADPFLFRPPGGSYDDAVVLEAQRAGLRLVNWNVDPQDWRANRTPKQIAKLVLSNVRPGSIVDLHDGGGDQSATIKALPSIIRGIRKMGLKLVAIPRRSA